MKEIKLKGIDEIIYYEKLDNGLDVYLYPKDDVYNNYVTFTTKFGSIYNQFVPIGEKKMKKVPYGVAHFLEHKVFEQKNGDAVDEFFSKSGTISNAYTTFKNTTYLFSGPNNLKNNILFLLDFVQSPYFTDENVEKEKGIITQEIHMCDDNPIDVLYEHIRKNMLHNNNYKDSIIGTVKDINSINKKILYTCYNTFYNPSNMFLVVTGSFDVNEILNAIKENQSSKKFKKLEELDIKKCDEDDSVVLDKEIINMDTSVPKVAFNIKISLKNKDINIKKYNLYLFLMFSILFGDSSDFDELAKNEGVITNDLYLNLLNCDSHAIISLINETNEYDRLIDMIKDKLKDIKIDEKDFERKKRVLISNELFGFENIEVINETIIDNILFDNKIDDDIIGLLRSLNINEMNDIIKNLDLSNNGIVIIKKK